ncbi:uncharacterized protein LY89DRAFT_388678 [Mollisia scopiformis]|uniref:Uncharacterized protein n=1 Tax=Mollisia scopiformis TaxID=149040 RepID=A0A194XNZ4_MOLSC|nr:uncharacterized protein LY89DRAFT_388678 [Mollisia scopiformis]KUJ21908.1 hypothetical protein LY89DRAFT_388678 [Mollisia scopiformis]
MLPPLTPPITCQVQGPSSNHNKGHLLLSPATLMLLYYSNLSWKTIMFLYPRLHAIESSLGMISLGCRPSIILQAGLLLTFYSSTLNSLL